VYVSIYSNLFIGNVKEKFQLSSLLSMRNTDPTENDIRWENRKEREARRSVRFPQITAEESITL